MSLGEVIAAIALCDDNWILQYSVCEIDVGDDSITIYTTDGNTRNITLDREGKEI